MSTIATLVGVALVVAACALAVIIFRFNQKRRHIAQCFSSASHEQLENIYALVERTGSVASNGYVLARTNQTVRQSRCLVPIPADLQGFPWSGRTVEATAANEVKFQFVEAAVTEPSLLGRIHRPVRVPRHRTKKSPTKQRNVFSTQQYIADSPALLSALQAVCPAYPEDLLSYLLCAGRDSFEFEPIDQARIGTSPAWVQDPEPVTCKECGKRMQLVVQLPGTLISRKAFRRGTFYLFGCAAHPHQIKTLGQFT